MSIKLLLNTILRQRALINAIKYLLKKSNNVRMEISISCIRVLIQNVSNDRFVVIIYVILRMVHDFVLIDLRSTCNINYYQCRDLNI